MLSRSGTANAAPARFAFVRSREAKERLRPALAPLNVEKTMTAPVTVIIGYDVKFYEQLPKLFPHNTELKRLFEVNPEAALVTAQRNSSLQGAYLILAARALGLDCGPMSGFDNAKVDEEFFAAGKPCFGCDQEFFAFQVVDLNNFVVDVFEIQNLADLGAKRTAQKLVEFCGHHTLRSSIARMVVAFMTPKLR